MFRVKICGITNIDDGVQAVAVGADAIGLNFYAHSPRFVEIEQAATIAAAVRVANPAVAVVGVFVNSPRAEIEKIASAVPLTAVQLHGDETPADVLALADWGATREVEIIRAFRCRDPQLNDVANFLLACRSPHAWPPAAVLLDAYQPGSYGGTGAVVDWQTVRNSRDQLQGKGVVLAGGLTAVNVAEAIRVSGADGVDVASGVESAPGKKDPHLVESFVTAALAAFGRSSG